MQALIFIPEKYRWTAYTGHIFVGNLDYWLQQISSLILSNYWHHVFQWYLISSSRVLNRMSITTKDEFTSMEERRIYPSRSEYPLKDSGCTTQLCKWRGKKRLAGRGCSPMYSNLWNCLFGFPVATAWLQKHWFLFIFLFIFSKRCHLQSMRIAGPGQTADCPWKQPWAVSWSTGQRYHLVLVVRGPGTVWAFPGTNVVWT